MKRFSLFFGVFLFAFTAFAKTQNAPTVSTDQRGYKPGQTITIHGTHWAAGEKVMVVITKDGVPGADQIVVRGVADENGSFTATARLPEESEAEERAREGRVRDAVAKKPRYTVTASGVTSRGTTTDFEEEEPVPDGANLIDLETYWIHRVSYPTGEFDPQWVRNAATEDAKIERRVPAGAGGGDNDGGGRFHAKSLSFSASPLSLNATSFTSLGPKPLRMTGCSGCFDYTTTSGRINTIAVDPTTTTNGSIVAYAGSVGGGVWKTTNCCSSSTSWTVVTDNVLTSTTSIDSVTIDPVDNNIIYAGTGDLNYGSFSMGSQGILKSTDAGAHWTVLGANIFGPAFPEDAGQFPQYQAVGKVRVDPNNHLTVVAGTKTGLYLSYDGGANWTGPCLTNTFTTQRQDITALELSNVGGSTRIIAGVGVRGFASTVQFNLGENGANGLYRATMPSSGCPSFTSIASNSNGFVLPASVLAAQNLNAGSGVKYTSAGVGNQLGRIDIGVAPSDPNVIYAQVQSITPNNNSGGQSGGCANANGCQLGAWSSTDGGNTWTFMTNSNGNALRTCNTTGPTSSATRTGDYPQNWYDQGVAVDPNNPDRVFFDTYEIWLATRTGSAWYNTTCGYETSNPHPVHVDQHALAFVAGSSSILLAGNDGGAHATTNADQAAPEVRRPTWFNMDTGFNTIEFYSGDISANFATSAAPQASGGAQDNGSMSMTFSGSPTAPVQWQMGVGGDGFYSRIDPVGTGTNLRFWQGNNSGGLSRCVSNCTAGGAGWASRRGNWTGDTQSFILPYDLFRGGIPGGDDCDAAGAGTGCGHLIAGTTRVYETVLGASTVSNTPNTWYITNNPPTQNMTKGSLGNRSFINQVKYSPKKQSVAIVGTNDANVWIGFNLGTGTAGQANWVNVTGGNTVLPNRPVLGIALDPDPNTVSPIGYAAVGGFNANTPTQPGHVFRVVCSDATCGSFTWQNKSGDLPDVPVDSIIANPNFPAQVFAGSDFGLYYTDDITANSPKWYRFSAGLPNVMIWDMQIDRGSTTLSLWTRSRGAYVWPLPQTPLTPLETALSLGAASGVYGGTVDLIATMTSGGNPIAGKSISFKVDGSGVGSATTNASGTATLTVTLTSIGAGPHATAASFAGNSVYAAGSASSTLSVDRAQVTPHFTASDKEYDGTTAATITSRTLSGVVGTDDVALTGGTATFSDKNAATGKLVTATGFSLGGTTAPNYVLTATTATTTASITQATLTVTANDASRLYSYPNPPFTPSYAGFKNGETLGTSDVGGTPSLTTTATATSGVGAYPIVAAAGSLTSNNYAFQFVNGTLTIYTGGFVGLNSATIGAAKGLVDSFNGAYPASAGNNALILSNGLIDVKGSRINGNIVSSAGAVLLEPGSIVTGDVTAATTITNQGTINGVATPNRPADAIVAAPVAPCGAFTPAGSWITGNYSYANGDLTVNGNSTATIAAGSYCFHNVKVNGQSTLQTSGAVLIRLTGTFLASGGTIVNPSHVVSNLRIASSFSGDDGVTISGGADAYLTMYAPQTSVAIGGGSPVFGAVLGKTLTISGNSPAHFDTSFSGF